MFNQELIRLWKQPEHIENLPLSDMPQERRKASALMVKKASRIFPYVLQEMEAIERNMDLKESSHPRIVLGICGGSGAGKTTMASIFTYFFRQMGIGVYLMSGDNYPHRIPRYNDAERLQRFRSAAIKGMIIEGVYSQAHSDQIRQWQAEDSDAEAHHLENDPWFSSYLDYGRHALENYLGTEEEIGFMEVEDILQAFKKGQSKLWLRHMGREMGQLFYHSVDFTGINLLILEWTHANSSALTSVDCPIFLDSRPSETLKYRQSRNRDDSIDSPFTSLVLDIEQELLAFQAKKAKLIVDRSGKVLQYDEYLESR